jgi:NTE family protein/lysophospholipid hydrolase
VRAFAGDLVVRAGDPASSVFALLRGRLRAESESGAVLAELSAGELVGEVTLLAGGRRSASVRVIEDAELLELDATRLREALAGHPTVLNQLAEAARHRLRRSQLARRLPQLLGAIDPDALHEIDRQVSWRTLRGGEVLFRAGDAPDGAYVLVSGRLRVSVVAADGERTVGELAPGETVGELALLTGEPRTATVCAIRDSELAHISDEAFLRLIAGRPTALRQVGRYVVERMRLESDGRRTASRAVKAIAIAPASPGVSLERFTAELVRALGALGRVRWLSARHVDSELGQEGIAHAAPDTPADTRLSHWLGELEAAHEFLLYETDPELTSWTVRALRQADHVLLVADPARTPGPLALVDTQHGADRSLALLHPKHESIFSGTARWLEALDVFAVHHVREQHLLDFARLARLMAGRAVALVLGGGGARGFAHIGVVRAFEELGLPIDLVGGTSMGAIIAGGVAMGLRSGDLLQECQQRFSRIFDPTLPLVALLAGRRVREALEAGFGGREIEDLPIPFFCVSTDLSHARETVHERGPLWRAVRASISLPGVLPPVAQDGSVLVDGGLLNNIPVDVMLRRARGGHVIAVDVSPEEDLAGAEQGSGELSGWRVLWQRLNPFLRDEQAAPHIASVLMRSTVVASLLRSRDRLEEASLYLRIPAADWRLLDFRSIEAIAERGYSAATGPLREWARARSPGARAAAP